MQTVNDYAAAAASYLAAALALFVEHSNTIVQALGFILLVMRLIHEAEGIIRMIKKWFAPRD